MDLKKLYLENLKSFVPFRLSIKQKYDLSDIEAMLLALIEAIIIFVNSDSQGFCGFSDDSLGEVLGKTRVRINIALNNLKDKDLIIILDSGSKARRIYLADYLRTEEEKQLTASAEIQKLLKKNKDLEERIQEQEKQINNLLAKENVRPNQFTQMLIDFNFLSSDEQLDKFLIQEYNILFYGLNDEIGLNKLKKILYYILMKRKEQSDHIQVKDKFKWIDVSIRKNFERFNSDMKMTWEKDSN